MDYFDLHCDTAFEMYDKKLLFSDYSLALKGADGLFQSYSQVFAFWIKDGINDPFGLYRKMYADFCKKTENIKYPKIYFSVEGGSLLEDDAERLCILKKDGIKWLTLTWNGENKIAGGSESEKGLTDFGKEVIHRMNRLKIGCDLSHLNKKSFFKAVEIADYPLCSHSNCFEVSAHRRNITDEQIKLIAQKSGIIGLCFYPQFLGGNVYEKIYENICHLCDMGLENNIAFGSDFDGADMDKSLSGVNDIPKLYRYLLKKGLNKRLIEKIFYGNAYKFIAKL